MYILIVLCPWHLTLLTYAILSGFIYSIFPRSENTLIAIHVITQLGLILSRLDYCNGLLTSVPVSHRKRLQSLQNWAARLIYRTNRRQDSSPLLQSLHWLPISKRVRYKLLLLVYKTFHKQSPQYMQTCILHHVPSRPNLRSSSDPFRLTFPHTHNKAGDRTFTVTAAKEWNGLPSWIREAKTVEQFRKFIKTHLFNM